MRNKGNTGSSAREDTPGAKQSLWVNLLLMVASPVVFFLVLELVLFVAGVRPILYEEDPYVGFTSRIPLFVEEGGPDGTAVRVTAKNKLTFFNEQTFPAEKPSGTYRIFCLGGSTTYGRPYNDLTSFAGWLRAMLPKADPSREWEVINAGGVSYASYRVATLMEELIEYEPDLFIVYSGHNEFLERRTYGEIMETSGLVRETAALLGRTRTYAMVKGVLDSASGPSEKPFDGPLSEEEMAVLPAEVDTILEHSVGPKDYHRDPETRRLALEHYGYNLNRMVDIAKTAGTPIIFVTPASNLRSSSPFKSEHETGLSEAQCDQFASLFEAAKTAYAEDRLEEALQSVDQALAIDDGYAHAHYLRGQVLWALQRYDDAGAAFIRARDEDVCPLRALSPMLETVVEVAQTRGVPLVDYAGWVEEHSPHGVPGEELFLDHVHPTIEANRELALLLLDELAQEGVVDAAGTWDEAAIAAVKKEVEDRIDEKTHAMALRNLAQVLGWAGKTEESHRLSTQAAELIPDDAPTLYKAGQNAEIAGEFEKALDYYQRALDIDPDYPQAHFGLADTLATQHKFEEAIVHYRRAIELVPTFSEAYNNLGNALYALDRNDEAESVFRHALGLTPEDPGLCTNLGNVLRDQGRLEEAAGFYKRALGYRPDFPPAHRGLGDVLIPLGRFDEALPHCVNAVRAMPDSHEARYNLGMVYLVTKKPDQALAEFREALRIAPQAPGPLSAAALTLVSIPNRTARDAEEALELGRRALEVTGYARQSLLDTFAAVCDAAGKPEEFGATLRQSLEKAKAEGDEELAQRIEVALGSG